MDHSLSPPLNKLSTQTGDEIAQTHFGNNNWYGHDNRFSHMHWAAGEQPERAAFMCFCSELIRFRKECPLLGRAEFLE